MNEPKIQHVKITGGFWAEKLAMNQTQAIFYQWEQLEKTRCIDNFRIAAKLKEGFREGFFFSDSDAYKWLDAASRILTGHDDPKLSGLVDELIDLIDQAQMPDGYIYTYNQIHFPGKRWTNLQIQHELYCLGHLIEACVSHFEATGSTKLLAIGQKSADLLVKELMHAPPDFTDGHEEIELALIKLWRVTRKKEYLDLSQALLERRGRIKHFAVKILQQNQDMDRQKIQVDRERADFYKRHSGESVFKLPEDNKHALPFLAKPRFKLSALNGKYFQQHLPLEKQTKAVGHSVRFTYLQTAAAMLARETGDTGRLKSLERVWENMVNRRMYVTGGIGSLPVSEGFGNDFELDPETAYAETCAALGSMLWNHEMSLLTGEPAYEDLYEWQLYNAASVGIARDGLSYFYNNPLLCKGGITRAGWFSVPCCPSNLSRVWAGLGRNVCSYDENEIRINQYISSEIELELQQPVKLVIESSLPWENQVTIKVQSSKALSTVLKLRLPAWAGSCQVTRNGGIVEPDTSWSKEDVATANGLHFNRAKWMILKGPLQPEEEIALEFDMPIRLLKQHWRVPKCGGKVAVARGPIVYCAESCDNGPELFNLKLDVDGLHAELAAEIMGGTWVIKGKAQNDRVVTLIPYMLWGNRGESKMTVFFNT